MRTYHRIWRLAAVIVLLGSTGRQAMAEAAYKLGPQDQLQVKVSDLRAGPAKRISGRRSTVTLP